MKKLFFVTALMGLSLFLFSQQADTIVSEPDVIENVVAVVSPEDVTAAIDSLNAALNRLDGVGDLPGELSNLIVYTVKFKDGFAYILKDMPEPSSPENVSTWIEFISKWINAIWPTVLFLVTAFFRIIKKSPVTAMTVLGKITSFIRTRWFIVGVGTIMTMIGVVFFNNGDFTLMNVITLFFNTILIGVGLNEVIRGIQNIIKKLQGTPETVKDGVSA